MKTCMPSCHNFSYMFLNLVGELGEFASKVAKSIRRGELSLDRNYYSPVIEGEELDEFEAELSKEAGDILWQLSGLCVAMGWTLEDVAKENLEKLASRQRRGLIDGNGDNR